MMRSIAVLTLLLLGLLQAPLRTRADAEPRPPLSLIEKMKKVQAGKDQGGSKPGMAIRVVGGKQVTSTTKYKWFVEWADSSCGASLIHDDIALSAAHCESTSSPFNMRVYVNGITSRAGMFRTIEQQVSHPLYKVENNNDYDIMLLKLHTSAMVDENGDPTGAELVELNDLRDVPQPKDPLVAVGFGFTQEGAGETSQVLNDVEVNYVNDTECLRQYGEHTYVADLMFCAGVEGGGKDTCQGDSGGPIIDIKTKTQVGVVSFGIGCARKTHNGVYARVSAVTDWIKEQLCVLSEYPPSYCPPKSSNSGIGEGKGKITISLTYDGYARETAFMFIHDDSGTQLYFQSYDAQNAANQVTEKHTFDNLPAGNYSLMIGDDGRDGFCCAYGNGELVVTDNTNDVDLWIVGANWTTEYILGSFTIDDAGLVTYNGNTTDYMNSWELSPEPPNDPAKVDQSWPGPLPKDPFSLNINIRFDRFPKETTWELSKLDGENWTTVESFDGHGEAVHNDLVSTQLTNLTEGWYQFEIKDRNNDGICCENRRGWVTNTGYLADEKASGVIWSDDGEFGSSVEVFMHMDAQGMVADIVDDESSIGRRTD